MVSEGKKLRFTSFYAVGAFSGVFVSTETHPDQQKVTFGRKNSIIDVNMSIGDSWEHGVYAETHPGDIQYTVKDEVHLVLLSATELLAFKSFFLTEWQNTIVN